MIFSNVQQQLDFLQIENNAAEVHGQLCGLLCVCKPDRAKSLWFASVLAGFSDRPGALSDEAGAGAAALAELDGVYTATRDQLASDDMDFSLLVASDSTVTMERMVLLSDWCSGFIFGFGMGTGDSQKTSDLPEDTDELLSDFMRIARFQSDGAESIDVDQTDGDLVEIEEYIRVGVLLIREEMHEALKLRESLENRTSQPAVKRDNSNPTLH